MLTNKYNNIKITKFFFIIGIILVVQIYLIYYGGSLFRTAGLTLKEFTWMILLAMTVIPVDFIRKLYLRRTFLSRKSYLFLERFDNFVLYSRNLNLRNPQRLGDFGLRIVTIIPHYYNLFFSRRQFFYHTFQKYFIDHVVLAFVGRYPVYEFGFFIALFFVLSVV